MTWKKLGRIAHLSSSSKNPLLKTHLSTPSLIEIADGKFKVFVSIRDNKNRSSIGSFNIDMSDLSDKTVFPNLELEFGNSKTFYSSGISLGNIFNYQGENFCGFMGWNHDSNSQWFGELGIIKLDLGMNMRVYTSEPIIDRKKFDVLSFSYPNIEFINNSRFEMWTGQTLTWNAGNGEMLHILKKYKSTNLMDWESSGESIPWSLRGFQAFSGPTCMTINNQKILIYSCRTNTSKYQIGAAISVENNWHELSKNYGLKPSPGNSWDSEMVEYPRVFSYLGDQYMLYNGNSYGKTGVGIAKWVNHED